MRRDWTAAAALLLATSAMAQQAQPPAGIAQPSVALGVGFEEDFRGPMIIGVAPGEAIGMRPGPPRRS